MFDKMLMVPASLSLLSFMGVFFMFVYPIIFL